MIRARAVASAASCIDSAAAEPRHGFARQALYDIAIAALCRAHAGRLAVYVCRQRNRLSGDEEFAGRFRAVTCLLKEHS